MLRTCDVVPSGQSWRYRPLKGLDTGRVYAQKILSLENGSGKGLRMLENCKRLKMASTWSCPYSCSVPVGLGRCPRHISGLTSALLHRTLCKTSKRHAKSMQKATISLQVKPKPPPLARTQHLALKRRMAAAGGVQLLVAPFRTELATGGAGGTEAAGRAAGTDIGAF